MKKLFIHTFTVVRARAIQVSDNVFVRLTIKQNWASPASSIFTKLFVIDVPLTALDVLALPLIQGGDTLKNLNLVGKTFSGYYKNGQVVAVVDMRKAERVDPELYEEVGKFNLAKDRDSDICYQEVLL